MLLRDNIYGALRSDILMCRLMPGEEIRELELAQRYEVSRQPVREALQRLERDRLVTVIPRQGYLVNPVSLADARDLFRFRLALEPACVAEAARAAPGQVLADLDRFRELPPGAAFIDYNREFHKAIAAASGNARMTAAASDLIEQADRLVRISISVIKGRDPASLVAEHQGVIDAMQARDARAARSLVRSHIAAAEKRVLSALGRSAVRH